MLYSRFEIGIICSLDCYNIIIENNSVQQYQDGCNVQ